MAKKKDFTGDPGGLIGDAMFSVIKPIYKEGEKLKRAASRPTPKRTYYAPEPKVSQKDIVFRVLPRAIRDAGSNFSTRDLYYATRPHAYAHGDWPADKKLMYPYFAQTLLTEYYAFPEYTFDKILYVEKEGEWPKLQAAKLAERYDMAIASSKGYPVEAVRELFAQAEGGEYQLFVFHDADIDGYEIVRVLGEATRRMPDHYVDVLDIGLNVADAVEMELPPEPYSRKGGVPATLRWRLTPLEREYFSGQHGHRFELNAILPDTNRIAYIERKLAENGVRGKVIPPDDKLPDLAEKIYQEKAEGWVDDALEEVISLTGIKDAVAKEFKEKFKLEDSRRYIEERHKKDITLLWKAALRNELEDIHDEHTDALKDAVEAKVHQALADDNGE